jgi:glycosylphosphatidylinositol transamidase
MTETQQATTPNADAVQQAPPQAADEPADAPPPPPASSSSSSSSPNNNNNNNKWKRLILSRKVLVLPYLLGLIWTCLHPIVSILTGEAKCRGWYLDENSLLIKFPLLGSGQPPNHLRYLPSPPKSSSSSSTTGKSLCDALQNTNTTNNNNNNNIGCYTHSKNEFQVASIIPLANALEPLEETIVFVVNPPPSKTDGWTSSSSSTTFHRALLRSLQVLADPVETPWLAKTFLVVSPIDDGTSLEDTVSNFLNAYHGTTTTTSSSSSQSSSSPLPPHLCQGLLRNLIVIDVGQQQQQQQPDGTTTSSSSSSSSSTEFSILPHGHRGVLPNADLVFLVGKLFGRTQFLGGRPHTRPPVHFLAHPHADRSKAIRDWTATTVHTGVVAEYFSYFWKTTTTTQQQQKQQQAISVTVKTWLDELGDLALFVYAAAVGPFPPHAPALDRGVDAITIRARFAVADIGGGGGASLYARDPNVEMVQYMEFLLHSLSGLHERLHHSFTLYWMPSPMKFVSHIEYLLPIVLLLLPCAIRAFGLVLLEMKGPVHLETIGFSLLVTIASMVSTGIVSLMIVGSSSSSSSSSTDDKDDSIIGLMNAWLLILY